MNQTQKILKWLLDQYAKNSTTMSVKLFGPVIGGDNEGKGIVVGKVGYLPAFIQCDNPKYIVDQFNKLKKKAV